MRFIILVVALVCCASVVGCGADTEGSCERIVEACHEKDTGAGEAHECHEFAEGGAKDDACSEKEDACLESCK